MSKPEKPLPEVIPTPSPSPTIRPADTVSFVAAGDNLIHGSIYLQAAARSTDGGYDFDYAYENTEDYFDDFDYIVGDIAYSKLRLKGFNNKNNKLYNKLNDYKNVEKYIKENCAFDCRYFILEKVNEK